MTKYCTKCKKEHPKSEFGKDSRSHDGLTSSCQTSLREVKAAYRLEMQEQKKLQNVVTIDFRNVPDSETLREYLSEQAMINLRTVPNQILFMLMEVIRK